MSKSKGLPTLLKRVGGLSLASAVIVSIISRESEKKWNFNFDPTFNHPLEFNFPNNDSQKVERLVVDNKDGAKLAVTVVEGVSPTVVFSHGWTENQNVWAPVVNSLVEKGQRIVVYDHQGHGQSTIGNSPLDVNRLALDLKEIYETLQIDESVLVGHSMGGMTAQTFIVNYPEMRSKVKGLVLVATTSRAAFGPEWFYDLSELVCGSTVFTNLMRDKKMGPRLVRFAVGRDPAISHLKATSKMASEASPKARGELAKRMRDLDLTKALNEIDLPASVMVGTMDRLTPIRCAKEINKNLKNSTLVVLQDKGHMLPFEAPKEIFGQIEDLL